MNTIEVSENVSAITEALYTSVEREQVEDVFIKNGILDKTDRIQLLRKCMNVLDISKTNVVLSPDDEYSDEMEIFLNGKWRFLGERVVSKKQYRKLSDPNLRLYSHKELQSSVNEFLEQFNQ